MTNIIISPSILSADFANLERDINLVEAAGADWLHIDVMDGHFVPNITIGIPVVKAIKKVTKLPLDVHLMIENPEKYAQYFIDSGADILTFHYEAMKNENEIRNLIKFIKSKNCKAGISLKPKTEVSSIIPFLNDLDLVLIMTVEPGFGGQKFISECADKISQIKHAATKNLFIQVDGGINETTAKICRQNGANSLVAGSYIYGAANKKTAIDKLKD